MFRFLTASVQVRGESGGFFGKTPLGGGNPQAVAHILRHAARITARTVVPSNALFGKISLVDVVMSDGGGDNQLHFAAFEQGAVHLGAGSRDEHVGFAHIVGRYGSTGEENALAEARCGFADEGNFVVDDESEHNGGVKE